MFSLTNYLYKKHLSAAIHLKSYCLTVIFVFVISGCIKESNGSLPEKKIIDIRPVITTGRINGNNFQSGDQIGLYAAISPGLPAQDNYVNNIAYTFDGTGWTPPEGYPITWPGNDNLDVYAYWPFNTGISANNPRSLPFTLGFDQTTEVKYLPNDFLWAHATGNIPGKPIPLLFSHLMSRVIINIHSAFDAGSNWPGQAKIDILGLSMDMIIDLADGSVTPVTSSKKYPPPNLTERVHNYTLTNTGERIPRNEKDVQPLILNTPAPGYELSLAAIVMPQDIQKNTPLIRVNFDNVDYIFIPDKDFSFMPGENFTINLTLFENLLPKGIRAEPGMLSVDANGFLNLDGRGHIVYFKWGSGVAVFGRENEYLFQGKEDIAWYPPGFDIESISGTGLAAWEQITYSTNPTTYPDHTNSSDILQGLCDPCQFATKDNQVGNYRISNGNPYEQFTDGILVSDYNGIAGRWSNYGSEKSQFYPFTGRILDGTTRGINTSAYYWSNTGNTSNNAYSIYISSSASNKYTSIWRNYGFAVRCVPK